MAEFCKQCSNDLFGKNFGDFAGLTTVEDVNAGLFAVVLCEDCGAIQVDDTGSCISPDCFKKHGVKISYESEEGA